MKPSKRLAAVLATALFALAGCGSGDAQPQPTQAKGFGFEVAAQYVAHATLDANHTERIILTVGKPTTAAAYFASHPRICKPSPTQDVLVPYYLEVTNMSLDKAVVGVAIAVSADTSATPQAFTVRLQDTQLQECNPVIPTAGPTAESMAKAMQATYADSYSPPRDPVAPLVGFVGEGAYVLTGIGEKAIDPGAFFLRLADTDGQGQVKYTITDLQVSGTDNPAEYITDGPSKGVYLVPLGTTSPCLPSFAGNVKLTCGTNLP